MNSGYDPFGPPVGDPFGAPPPAPVYRSQPSDPYFVGPPGPRLPNALGRNTFATLAPILAVILPPVGVVLGHLALTRARRKGLPGRDVAIGALVVGYSLCVALVVGGLWWAGRGEPSTSVAPTATGPTSVTAAPLPAPSVVTSIAPPTDQPHVKLDLATVVVGACVQIQIRSTTRADALDLYRAECRHNDGVYAVAERVNSSAQCHSDFAAAPPDLSFALCLNPY